jgi:hypothetical protein
MGKVLKGTKKQFIDLMDIVDRVPSSKAASEIGKHITFRRSLKKVLKSFLDEKSEILAAFEVKRKLALVAKNKLDQAIAIETDVTQKAKLEKEKEVNNDSLLIGVNEVNSKVAELVKESATKNMAVSFDHEAFDFENRVIRDNVAKLFADSADVLNNEKLEVVFDLLDTVTVETVK